MNDKTFMAIIRESQRIKHGSRARKIRVRHSPHIARFAIFNPERSSFSVSTWYQNEISYQNENSIRIENRNDLNRNEMSFPRYWEIHGDGMNSFQNDSHSGIMCITPNSILKPNPSPTLDLDYSKSKPNYKALRRSKIEPRASKLLPVVSWYLRQGWTWFETWKKIGQSCCNITSKRSIDWVLRKFSARQFFQPSVRFTSQKPRAFVSVR